ncbi:MAG: hypothetical protein JSW20_00495 [Nitrospiraceae bacterium]|nr:MAG: hypothetical protein JSW20_00495 [Nitrospiraceae bacterium]
MDKLNCWDIKKCGRELGGKKAAKRGACPASTCTSKNGANGGINAGRSCWSAEGTICCSKIQGTYTSKLESCVGCEVFLHITAEEGLDYIELFNEYSMTHAHLIKS